MSFKTLIWTSSTRLSCVGCLPADIVICVPNTFIAHPDTTYQAGFINATLVTALVKKNNCGQTFYQYAANYDDAQVVIGANLTATDILGTFCKGCMTSWVEDLIALSSEGLERTYFPSVKTGPDVTIGVLLASLAQIPNVVTVLNTNTVSFTNTSDKPVFVDFTYETPYLRWAGLESTYGYAYTADVTVVNDGSTVVSVVGSPIAEYTDQASGNILAIPPSGVKIGTGSFEVAPGTIISMTTNLTITPANIGGGSVQGSVTVLGPWINYSVSPANV